MAKIKSQKLFYKRFKILFKSPVFWTLTAAGNFIILTGSFLLWTFESGFETISIKYIDCLLWSAGIVTTVGYSDYTPRTIYGKLTVLFLMLLGTLFVWSYMAFWVTGLIAPELSSLERDVHEVEKEVRDLKMSANEERSVNTVKL